MAAQRKTGGRQRGVPNRRSLELAQKLAELKCDPVKGMARIAMAEVPCPVCAGRKKAKFSKAENGRWQHDPLNGTLMKCLACYGSGKGRVSLELQGKMLAELAQYLYPKRKAIEVSVDDPSDGAFTLEELLSTYKKFDEVKPGDRRDG